MRTVQSIAASILAIGLLVGTASGAVAQDEEPQSVVTSFTGVFHPDGEPLPVEGTWVDLPNGFGVGTPGHAWLDRMESTDPRMAGEHSVIANWVIDPNGFDPWSRGDEVNLLVLTSHTLTNDGGSWIGEGTSVHSTDLDIATESIVFVGQDGYAGLTAYAVLDLKRSPPTVSGVIFPATLPEKPEPYMAEKE